MPFGFSAVPRSRAASCSAIRRRVATKADARSPSGKVGSAPKWPCPPAPQRVYAMRRALATHRSDANHKVTVGSVGGRESAPVRWPAVCVSRPIHPPAMSS